MDLFFAGSEAFTDLVFNEPVNVLMSYYYVKNKFDKFISSYSDIKNKKIFIDSGAFTAWTNGVKIDPDEYCQWINDRRDYFYVFGQIDSIPGKINQIPTKEEVEKAAKETWENYLYMREKIIRPEGLLYTFHVGEPFNYLKQALEWTDSEGNHIPYIALGGMVGKTYLTKKNFLDRCFEIIKNSSNSHVKVHAFGMTSFDLLRDYPITSADSTSWIMTGANGGIATEKGVITISEKQSNSPDHFSHIDDQHINNFNDELSQFGYTLQELSVDYNARLKYHLRFFNHKASQLKEVKIEDYKCRKRLF